MGLNEYSGEPVDPQMEGIFDNYSVKRQIINSGYIIAFSTLNFSIVSYYAGGLCMYNFLFHVAGLSSPLSCCW